MIRVLQDGESIELQAIYVPSLSRHAGLKQSKSTNRKAEKLQAKSSTLSINIYGSKEICETIGNFLTQCSEYLQTPLHCDRNVPYCNPQSLMREGKDLQMTFQLEGQHQFSQVEDMARSVDPSAALEIGDSNPEVEAPAAVRSSLYRYFSDDIASGSFVSRPIDRISWLTTVSHQKRALSFMLMRERGLRPPNKQTEHWRTVPDESDETTE